MGRLPHTAGREVLDQHVRLPEWLRQERISLGALHAMKRNLRQSSLHTVCEEARCPNRGTCFAQGTATFLLMGNICSRACGFCSVTSGQPKPLDPGEAQAVAERIQAMALRYAVLTSVTRDDLPDGGACHFAQTLQAIRHRTPETGIEVLTPDFSGDLESLTKVISAGPSVFNHNVETVPSLYPIVRPQAHFGRSLEVLRTAYDLGKALWGETFRTKSGLMLGLGEERTELLETFSRLLEAKVEILTLGQYLRPSRFQLPVVRYLPPEEFQDLGLLAKDMGFKAVYSGPLVRSSYHAEEVSQSNQLHLQ